MKTEKDPATTSLDGDLQYGSDVYYVLFVYPNGVTNYTSPIYSQRAAEKHADWLIGRGFNSVKVVKEV